MPLPHLAGIMPAPGSKPIVFAGCDSAYAIEHAVPLLHSLAANGGGNIAAHVHVVNPSTEAEEALARAAAHLSPRLDVTSTWETVDLDRAPPVARAAYYASCRFVRAVQVMDVAARPVLVLDADSIVRRPLDIAAMADGVEAALFLRPDHPPHMAVAAGAVLFTPAGADFSHSVAATIAAYLAAFLDGQGELGWYFDQAALAAVNEGRRPTLRVLGPEFMDWTFQADSVVWTGKGPRKHAPNAYRAEHGLYAARATSATAAKAMWTHSGRRRALVPLMAPDLPYKRPVGCVQGGRTKLSLRAHWGRLADEMEAALTGAGWQVFRPVVPGWHVTLGLVDSFAADLVLVPHRERHQFACETPALFWMQTPIQHLFTIDPQGWGAGASGYPFDHMAGDPASAAAAELRARIDANESKFGQPPRQTRDDLIAAGLIPDGDYILFPCQLPHDETVRFHSEVDEADLVARLAAWTTDARVHVVFKGHPANPASMTPLRRAAGTGPFVRWVEHDRASIHDLIAHSAAVYTINSGAGLEAILHGKPVVVFGRAEYESAAITAEPHDLPRLWPEVKAWPATDPDRGARFADWFATHHAFDSRPGRFDAARFLAKIEAVAGRASATAAA